MNLVPLAVFLLCSIEQVAGAVLYRYPMPFTDIRLVSSGLHPDEGGVATFPCLAADYMVYHSYSKPQNCSDHGHLWTYCGEGDKETSIKTRLDPNKVHWAVGLDPRKEEKECRVYRVYNATGEDPDETPVQKEDKNDDKKYADADMKDEMYDIKMQTTARDGADEGVEKVSVPPVRHSNINDLNSTKLRRMPHDVKVLSDEELQMINNSQRRQPVVDPDARVLPTDEVPVLDNEDLDEGKGAGTGGFVCGLLVSLFILFE